MLIFDLAEGLAIDLLCNLMTPGYKIQAIVAKSIEYHM